MSEPAPQGSDDRVEYVGFWARFLAFVVDSVWVGILAAVVVGAIFGTGALTPGTAGGGPSSLDLLDPRSVLTDPRELLRLLIAAAAVIGFWIYRSATPGKMIIDAVIVDARTLGKPTTAQLVIRYLGYFLSTICLMLGFLWIAFDSRKRGWHDLLAGTVVVRRRSARPQAAGEH